MDMDKRSWQVAMVVTVVMSMATAIGNVASSFILSSAKMKDEAAKAAIERRARGAQFHCEKLQQAASLAAEIEFRVSRSEANTMRLGKITGAMKTSKPSEAGWSEAEAEQRVFEKRASELMPFLEKTEAGLMAEIALHHNVLTNPKQWGAERAVPLRVSTSAAASGPDRTSAALPQPSADLIRAVPEESAIAPGERTPFNPHRGLAILRGNAAELAQIYRMRCSDGESAGGQ
jgi:hypothetical protein